MRVSDIRSGYLSAIAGASLAALLAPPAYAALTISTDATSNVTCGSGVCSATAPDAALNVTDLNTMLASGNLTVQSGSEAQDILVEAPFSWTSSNALTLDSWRAITVDQPVSDAGPAPFTLITNDGGMTGLLSFGVKGRVSFLSTANSLTINNQAYTLVDSITALASAVASNPAGAYALAGNYDASVDGTYHRSAIATPLTGSFEGLGNTISHFALRTTDKRYSLGLFAELGTQDVPNGNINNLRLAQVDVSSGKIKAYGAAGLAGENWGTVFGVEVQGKFDGNCSGCAFAGLAVVNYGTISNSSADVQIKASRGLAGGIAGDNLSVIENSHSSGTISAAYYDGGIAAISEILISNSYSTATVKGTGESSIAGGLVGDDRQGAIVNSYATGTVEGGDTTTLGGLIGRGVAVFSSSYSTGAVEGGNPILTGGFIGENDRSVFNDCYWDIDTSGTDTGAGNGNVSGLTSLTTTQFQSKLPKGFKKKVWAQDKEINNGYPYLINNPPS